MLAAVRRSPPGSQRQLFLIGVINYLRVPQLPVVAARLCIFNRWTAGIGQFTESVRLIAPDQTTVLSKGESKFELRDPAMHATNVMVFGNVNLKPPGLISSKCSWTT